MTRFNLTGLVDKYIKSATFGLKYSERTKRLFSILLIPIWLFCLVLCVWLAIDGTQGIVGFKTAKGLQKDIPVLQENSNRMRLKTKESVSLLYVNTELYKELGIQGAQPWDENLPQIAMSIQKARIYSLIFIPIYITLFFFLPWIILRLIFWIKTANPEMKT